MTAHTPGPWKVSLLDATGEESPHHIFIEPGVAVIERKVDGRYQHDMPNAYLISAAPDLLEALRTYLAYDEYICGSICEQPEVMARMAPARAAIAKATGAA